MLMQQDDIIASEAKQFDLYVAAMSPVYRTLAEVMLHKSMLPFAESAWTSEEKELLRCYRQDLADTMVCACGQSEPEFHYSKQNCWCHEFVSVNGNILLKMMASSNSFIVTNDS
jgi:hypothetical protein